MRRLESIASRRDILLFVAASVAVLAITIVWAFALVGLIDGGNQTTNKYLVTLVVLGFAVVVAAIPLLLGWDRARDEGQPRGRLGLGKRSLAAAAVRFGLAAELFGVLITLVGLAYASDPTRSVPVAFAAFTAVLLGLFVAGIGGNVLAPVRA